jgi:hypothetical protein
MMNIRNAADQRHAFALRKMRDTLTCPLHALVRQHFRGRRRAAKRPTSAAGPARRTSPLRTP